MSAIAYNARHVVLGQAPVNVRVRRRGRRNVVIAPVLLGRGERQFADVDMVELGYEYAERVATPSATHVVLRRRSHSYADSGAAPDPRDLSGRG